jgi:hypothetical protein
MAAGPSSADSRLISAASMLGVCPLRAAHRTIYPSANEGVDRASRCSDRAPRCDLLRQRVPERTDVSGAVAAAAADNLHTHLYPLSSLRRKLFRRLSTASFDRPRRAWRASRRRSTRCGQPSRSTILRTGRLLTPSTPVSNSAFAVRLLRRQWRALFVHLLLCNFGSRAPQRTIVSFE